MREKQSRKRRWYNQEKFGLRFIMTLFTFIILLASIAITGICVGILTQLNIIAPFAMGESLIPLLLSMLLFSIVLNTIMTALGSKRMIKPIHKVIEATRTVAEGDFSVRLDVGQVPELEELNYSFNKMVEELGSIETLRNDFVSTFSHEFKTPIVSIRGFAKLLRDKNLPEEERAEYIDIIISESERLADLSNNILMLSKLENVGILTSKESFRLDEQIRRTAALLESHWEEKRLHVSFHMDKISIYSDAQLLQQVWMNLFDNAIKFTDMDGHISIVLKQQDNQAVFTIEDTGCGMDSETLAHIFDKFYQSDASRSGAGNGLGLSLVQRAVSLCGGTVKAESRSDRGSRFTVTLPAK